MIQLEPGMWADCVDAGSTILEQGHRYMILGAHDDCVTVKELGIHCHFLASRFRPVVRVKAGAVYTGKAFDILVARAVEAFGRLSLEQQAAHCEEQRKSWVSAEIKLAEIGIR